MSGAPRPPVPPVSTSSDEEFPGVSLSHDLRAPLRVIEGFARILKEDYAPLLDRRGQDHLERILTAAHRMNGMIDTLMELSQLGTQPLNRRAVDLSALAAQILDELQQSDPRRRVQARVQAGLVRWGDPTLLQRVLENLLGNAWKYSARQDPAIIEFSASLMSDGRTQFAVRDNGAGFDMRLAGQLFAPFQRLHSATDFPGHGVGLATVKRIIERHGGQVGAHGEPGQGSRFWFTLAERAREDRQGI